MLALHWNREVQIRLIWMWSWGYSAVILQNPIFIWQHKSKFTKVIFFLNTSSRTRTILSEANKTMNLRQWMSSQFLDFRQIFSPYHKVLRFDTKPHYPLPHSFFHLKHVQLKMHTYTPCIHPWPPCYTLLLAGCLSGQTALGAGSHLLWSLLQFKNLLT